MLKKMHLRIGKKVQLQNGNNSKRKIEIKVQMEKQCNLKMKIKDNSKIVQKSPKLKNGRFKK